MIVIEGIEQGSAEWHALRRGIPTASQFDRIITADGRRSAQLEKLAHQLADELVYPPAADEDFQSDRMERGVEMEPQARAYYLLKTGRTIDDVTLVYKDEDRQVACSPDGLRRHKGLWKRGLEIKCPTTARHAHYVLSDGCPRDYIPQVQGSMWVTGLEVWDFVSFHPERQPLIREIKKDFPYCRELAKLVKELLEIRDDAAEKLRSMQC